MAIKTFTDLTTLPASDINTYLANAGLVFVKQVTIGTNVSVIPVTDAFSSTYDNYRIIVSNYTSNVNGFPLNFQFEDNSGNPITTNYWASGYFMSVGTGVSTLSPLSHSPGSWEVGRCSTGVTLSTSFDVMSPFLAQASYSSVNASGSDFAGQWALQHRSATSFTRFRITMGGQLSGGFIRVYGYRQA
jgi:hypothetical protein